MTQQPLVQPLLLSLTASEAEATFLSLPYVEELMQLSRHWAFASGPSRRSHHGGHDVCALVRDRLEVERHCEEYYTLTSEDVFARALPRPESMLTTPPPQSSRYRERASKGSTGHFQEDTAATGEGGNGGGGVDTQQHLSPRSASVGAEAASPSAQGARSPGRPSSTTARRSLSAGNAARVQLLPLDTPEGTAAMWRTAYGREADCGGSPAAAADKGLMQDAFVPTDTTAQRGTQARSLYLLRLGLTRALGLRAPAGDARVDDLVLNRTRFSYVSHPNYLCPLASSLDSKGQGHPQALYHPATPIFCTRQLASMAADEDPQPPHAADDAAAAAAFQPHAAHLMLQRASDDEQAQQDALLEWFEDTLEFARRRDFSAVQTRCFLLDSVALLESVFALATSRGGSGDAISEADIEDAAASLLKPALAAQACAVPTMVLERQTVLEAVTRQVPDPQVVAALELRLKKEKLNKKQQQQMREMIDQAPLVPLTSSEERVVEVEREVMVGPYFTLAETAEILEYLTSSVLTHWRLLTFVMTQPRPVQKTVFDPVLIEDTFTHCLPPLQKFIPVSIYAAEAERRGVWSEAHESLSAEYDTKYVVPIQELLLDQEADRQRIREAKEKADEENRENKLTSGEFDHVERAFVLRLNRTMEENRKVGPLAASIVAQVPKKPVDAAAKTAAAAPPGRRAPAPPASKKPIVPKVTVVATPTRVQADTIVVASDTVFSAADVEGRLERMERTLEEQDAAKSKKKLRSKK